MWFWLPLEIEDIEWDALEHIFGIDFSNSEFSNNVYVSTSLKDVENEMKWAFHYPQVWKYNTTIQKGHRKRRKTTRGKEII